MFEKSLSDVIRGIRACSGPDQVDEYIHACIGECRREVAVPSDPHVNAQAVLKLAYLHMMGYSADWASFHILKCMSLAPFHLKFVGYLAAQLIFTPKTDVLLLTTNQLKKDLAANLLLDSSLAVATLSEIVTKDLAGDLAHDLVAKANHFNPHTRRRVLLALYRTLVASPDDLADLVVPHLTQLIADSASTDPGVVACAVSVVCELALADPAAYLPLAPHLFGLLTSSGNNWMLIKLVKVFARMCQLEPRLAKKLGPPLGDLIRGTRAMSLQYECVNAALLGGLTRHPAVGPQLAPLCRDTLVTFLVHRDANLRYVGLVATQLLVTHHVDLVTEQLEDAVFECLEAVDPTIRHQAMDVLAALVTPANLMDVVAHLLKSVQTLANTTTSADNGDQPPPAPATMDRKTATVILDMLTRNGFALVTDLDWLVASLVHLATDPAASKLVAAPLASHLMDLALRGGPQLPSLRPLLVGSLFPLLSDPRQAKIAPVVWAAVCWIVGEYVAEGGVDPGLALESLVATKVPADAVRHVWVQAVAKVGTVALWRAVKGAGQLIEEGMEDDKAEMSDQVKAIVADLVAQMELVLRVSENAEAVERAQSYLSLLSALSTPASSLAALLDTMLHIYFGTSLPPSSHLMPTPLPAASTSPPISLDDWLSPAAEAFFTAPPEPFVPPMPEPVTEPATSSHSPTADPSSSTTSTRLLGSAPGSRSTSPARSFDSSVLGSRTPPTQQPPAGSKGKARSVLRKAATAAPEPLLAVAAGSGSSSKSAGSGSMSSKKGASSRTTSGGGSGASLIKGGTAAGGGSDELVVENEDMRLSVALAPPRAPPATSSAASSAAHFAHFLPLTVAFTPKHALCPAVQLHLAYPEAMVATGTREGLLLPAPTAARATKLVLLKLRKSAARDTLGQELVVRAVTAAAAGEPGEVLLAAHVPLTVPHLLTDPAGLAVRPEAFEAKLLAPEHKGEFACARTVAVAVPAETTWVHVARAARMYLVEVVGEAATLWGKMEGEAGEQVWVAAMGKMVVVPAGGKEVRMQVKAGEEWVAKGVCEGVKVRVPLLVEASRRGMA